MSLNKSQAYNNFSCLSSNTFALKGIILRYEGLIKPVIRNSNRISTATNSSEGGL